MEALLVNSSLQQCRRANSELVVDVQLTQLNDKTTALDAKTTQLTRDINRYMDRIILDIICLHSFPLRIALHLGCG